MNMGKLGSILFWGMTTIAVSVLPASAFDRSAVDKQSVRSMQLAQATDAGCRQTNAVTGVYLQPDLTGASAGVLPAGETIRLQVLGTGTGWARISEPVVGWVEAKYLTPATPCAAPTAYRQINQAPAANPPITTTPQAASTSAPTQRTFPQPANPPVTTARSSVTVPDLPSSQQPVPQSQFPQPQAPVAARSTAPAIPSTNSATAPTVVTVTCDVLPVEGLVVRNQPDLATGTGLYTIPQGTHNFQFTGATRTIPSPEGQRRWAYILAPYQGWISVGMLNGGTNLGGRTCG